MDILSQNCDAIANLDLAQLDSGALDPIQLMQSRSDCVGNESFDKQLLSESGEFEKCQVL